MSDRNDPPDLQHDESERAERDEPARQSLSVWEVIGSTLAAAIGVQSSRNRERDFTRGKPWQFIAAGIIFTALFVLTIALVVTLVL